MMGLFGWAEGGGTGDGVENGWWPRVANRVRVGVGCVVVPHLLYYSTSSDGTVFFSNKLPWYQDQQVGTTHTWLFRLLVATHYELVERCHWFVCCTVQIAHDRRTRQGARSESLLLLRSE
jgi:hypothetical protein